MQSDTTPLLSAQKMSLDAKRSAYLISLSESALQQERTAYFQAVDNFLVQSARYLGL